MIVRLFLSEPEGLSSENHFHQAEPVSPFVFTGRDLREAPPLDGRHPVHAGK